VGNLRLVLDVVVSLGKQTSAFPCAARLDGLAPIQCQAMVRGDCGFGNEPFIEELETRNQPYLFKLRQTKGIHKLLQRQFQREDWALPGSNDQRWSAVEDTVKLSGWDHARRVVILHRAVKHAGQCTLYLTAMHAAGKSLIALVSNTRLALTHVKVIAEQLPTIDRWHTLLNYIVSKISRRSPPIYDQLITLEMG
jgi:hypothetical protein